MAIESIAKTLGSGSGIDITSLVTQLVDAQYAVKNQALTTKADALTAKISSISDLKSNLTQFASALASLSSGTTLSTQPTSSNTGIVNVTGLAGAKLQNLNASLEVRQLAQSQVASTNAFAGGSTTDVGTGTLTLTFGNATVDSNGAMTGFAAGAATPIDITIDSSHTTLAGVAQAINAANAGVTASVMSDTAGARLVIKSATGASQAFTLQGTDGLAALNVGVGEAGSSVNTKAQDAIVALDGVQTTRTTNSISSLIDGVKIDLVTAQPGTKVTIGAKPPTDTIKTTVTNFVETYNEVYKLVKAAVDPTTGPLRGDAAAKDLLRSLKAVSMSSLISGAADGAPSTLSGIGVATQRDGTLTVDTSRLASAATSFPKELEAMFAASSGLTKVMNDISDKAINKLTGLGASEQTYVKQQSNIEIDQEDAAAAAEKLRTRMTRQFAAMDSRVAAYKATQSFLTNQVAAWNKS